MKYLLGIDFGGGASKATLLSEEGKIVAGMSRAGTVIAINSDKNAPIFEYADFGVLEEF